MEENTGINMLSPYYFINNLLYDATIDKNEYVDDNVKNTALPIKLFRYASVTINVWLFKGVHHFFKCEDETKMPTLLEKYMTQICSVNRNKYEIPKSDNIVFNFKPMYCSERNNYFSQLDRYGNAYTFDKNCVDLSRDPKP